jgi:hypothetical protein
MDGFSRGGAAGSGDAVGGVGIEEDEDRILDDLIQN